MGLNKFHKGQILGKDNVAKSEISSLNLNKNIYLKASEVISGEAGSE